MSVQEAWAALTGPFGLTEAVEGQEVRAAGDRPALSGRVEAVIDGGEKHAILVASEPGPGVCDLSAVSFGEQSYLSVRFYLFGEEAAEAVAVARPEWEAWLAKRFPSEGE